MGGKKLSMLCFSMLCFRFATMSVVEIRVERNVKCDYIENPVSVLTWALLKKLKQNFNYL